ncbi:hypothetical protein [Haloprofundus salilacus]|uniref:hypothetical protein n=1 Tax=Haloprofundus salilacus TaxID=2876190 RepID=UPI001CCD62AA|nr:hypothetical protein [Haloprofundus salilacus]
MLIPAGFDRPGQRGCGTAGRRSGATRRAAPDEEPVPAAESHNRELTVDHDDVFVDDQ